MTQGIGEVACRLAILGVGFRAHGFSIGGKLTAQANVPQPVEVQYLSREGVTNVFQYLACIIRAPRRRCMARDLHT